MNPIDDYIAEAGESIRLAVRHNSLRDAQVAQAEATLAVAEAIKHLAVVIAAGRSSVELYRGDKA